jgi:hypothetical protein
METPALNPSVDLRRLPPWKDTLAKMEPITFGSRWRTEWLEEQLCARRDQPEFCFGIDHLNRAIRPRGFVLTCRGEGGVAYRTLHADEIPEYLATKEERAKAHLRNAETVAAGVLMNPEANLTTLEREAIEHKQRNLALKLALLQRHEDPVIDPALRTAELRNA